MPPPMGGKRNRGDRAGDGAGGRRSASFRERMLVDTVGRWPSAHSCRQFQSRGCRALQEDTRGRIRALESFERTFDGMWRLADSVAVEIEAAVPAPVVAAAVDTPLCAGIASAQHDVAPVVGEPVSAERVVLGTREERRGSV